jgi:sulfate/thiosulfate transport system substrate-binding protein
MNHLRALVLTLIASVVVLTGCGSSNAQGSSSLTLGAFSTPSEAYAKIIPLFQSYWKQQDKQDISFKQSYLGSGAQSRAIINGFQADVAALSLAPDIDAISKAGLITHDWTKTSTNGMVSDSIVAFAVRQGNPKNIHDWADLAKPGIKILTPDPKTSGGAQWNILALYGAALRGQVTGVPKDDKTAALHFLIAILKNVIAFDKDARTSITNFESGIGDVSITYESEVLVARQAGKTSDLVVPTSTILIENPVAVVDSYVNKHGTRKAAEAFVNFLTTQQAQEVFAGEGLRSVNQTVAQETSKDHPAVSDLWKVDYLGGWKNISSTIFNTGGIYDQAIAAAKGA